MINEYLATNKERGLKISDILLTLFVQTKDTLMPGKIYLIQKVPVEIFTACGSERGLDLPLPVGLVVRPLCTVRLGHPGAADCVVVLLFHTDLL